MFDIMLSLKLCANHRRPAKQQYVPKVLIGHPGQIDCTTNKYQVNLRPDLSTMPHHGFSPPIPVTPRIAVIAIDEME